MVTSGMVKYRSSNERFARSRRQRRRLVLCCAVSWPLLVGSLCEGDGSHGAAPVRKTASGECTPLTGLYPSGFEILPGAEGLAVAMEFLPAALKTFDLNFDPPLRVSPDIVPPFPVDSDSDGSDDAIRYVELGICRRSSCAPVAGSLEVLSERLVALSTSTYDQIVFLETPSGELSDVWVENPTRTDAYDPDDYPVLPAGGETRLRSAISTKTCIYPPEPFDSEGDMIEGEVLCDPDAPSYLSTFTNAKVRVAGRLFVATANALPSGGRYNPGSVLVYDFDESGDVPLIRPHPERRLLFTTHFNPTGLTLHQNSRGRDLVLVTSTGALSASGSVLTPGGIDVIDVASLRVVATIPLEYAGASFGRLAIDPTGRVALAGSDSKRHLYAVDLIALEDAALYPGPGEEREPVLLDGSTPGFPDARIFSGDAPFVLPHRSDGPSELQCPTRTNVAMNAAGDLAFATDWCDGTLIVVAVDLAGVGDGPISRDRFRVQRVLNVLHPKDPKLSGVSTAPSLVRVRPGIPGVDYLGVDVFFIGNEDAQLCSVEVEGEATPRMR